MMAWIENWLIVGLVFDWLGLMMQRHGGRKHQQPPYHWVWDIACILIWPVSLAAGIVIGLHNRKKRK